jgi:hypothetical protein
MMPMTTAGASKVSGANIENLLRRAACLQTLGTIAFDNLLATIEVVVVFTLQTGYCIGLLGVTLEDITLD